MDITDLAQSILKLACERKHKVALAESCSGGRIAAALTAIPQASHYLQGGIVCYQNSIKQKLVGVPAEVLQEFGAVSEQTAKAMAIGCLEQFNATLTLATTGLAGPDRGDSQFEVGQVFIALASTQHCQVISKQFEGDRLAIIEQATAQALTLLYEFLIKN